jgi:pimeloyl-ACP methyl ester carboxylesterase
MPTFVLLHGAWHGAWCWGRVMPLLAAAGHRVTAPTFTGLGERRHLASRAVDLQVAAGHDALITHPREIADAISASA